MPRQESWKETKRRKKGSRHPNDPTWSRTRPSHSHLLQQTICICGVGAVLLAIGSFSSWSTPGLSRCLGRHQSIDPGLQETTNENKNKRLKPWDPSCGAGAIVGFSVFLSLPEPGLKRYDLELDTKDGEYANNYA
ncbi:hypothetical protein B0H13DRAFT_1916303 [Mycena leptocephala]|nr:hypothetical protein B0H13DRAFT_1916303 [Mycena leptocephala]